MAWIKIYAPNNNPNQHPDEINVEIVVDDSTLESSESQGLSVVAKKPTSEQARKKQPLLIVLEDNTSCILLSFVIFGFTTCPANCVGAFDLHCTQFDSFSRVFHKSFGAFSVLAKHSPVVSTMQAARRANRKSEGARVGGRRLYRDDL